MKSTEELLKEIYSHFPESENPEETVSDLIVDCIETGIDYWCTKWPNVYSTKEYYSEKIWDALKSGKTLEFGDEETTGKINLEEIAKALNTLKKNRKSVYNDLITENWDAYSCDTFFQTALFGEVIFG